MPVTQELIPPQPSGPEERFNDARLTEMVDDLISREVLSTNKDFAIGVIEGSDPASDLGRSVEYKKFQKVFNNGYDLMEQEYTRFDPQSTFIVVVDMKERKPAGVVRFIKDGPEGFKTPADVLNPDGAWKADMLHGIASVIGEDAVNQGDLSPQKMLDVATMARADEYDDVPNKYIVGAALYRAAYLYGKNNDYRSFITIMDMKPFGAMQRNYDEPYLSIEGIQPASYLDSPDSLPCYCHIPTYEARIANQPQLKDFVENGNPLNDLVDFAK